MAGNDDKDANSGEHPNAQPDIHWHYREEYNCYSK
jgi:hypothetical protein